MIREVRHAARSLLRAPSFSLITLVTLALGIGAATAIFTLLDSVVLRPLPYADADRLVELSSPVPKLKGQSVWGLARHEMFYFLQSGHSLENLAVYQTSEVTVLGAVVRRPAGGSAHPGRGAPGAAGRGGAGELCAGPAGGARGSGGGASDRMRDLVSIGR